MINRLLICTLTFFTLSSGLIGFGKEVVKISTKATTEGLRISFLIDRGYGIQRDARNKINLTYFSSKKNYVVNEFYGSISKKDDRYYNTLNPVNIPYDSISRAQLEILFYYCQFQNKFCSVQKSKINLP